MSLRNYTKNTSGFTLVEILVVIGIVVVIFGALFASFEYSLKLIAHSRSKMTALSLATDRMEYVRSLPYNDVGTVSGIPNGAIPQNRTVTLNGITFTERVLIEFVDDDADGSGALDSNSILADYKKIKVEYTWDVYGTSKSFSLISTVVPRSIETTAGGGTLRVNVFDASVSPLSGIDVRLLNTTGTSTIDVTRKTDATGTAYFTGAPANSGYEIFVSAPGYSSDQTRQATTSLPNPTTLPVAILESDVSTMNFQIDRVSDLTFRVLDTKVTDEVEELFADTLGIIATSSTEVVSGSLELAQVAGVYDGSGYALLAPISPATIASWGVVSLAAVVPAGTDVRARFYSSTNTADLIPEGDLPGNLVGFLPTHIDISGLDVATYPSLVMGLYLSTTDTSLTPQVSATTLGYVESETVLSGTAVAIRGNKSIGTDLSASPIFKFDVSTTTDAAGEVVLENIEWDSYTVTLGGGLVVSEACSANPVFLPPDTDTTVTLSTAAATAHNVRIAVQEADGTAIVGAAVELRLGGSTWNAETGWCGQVFFNGLSDSSDYELEVSASGFTTQTLSSTTVSGTTVQAVTLVP